MIKFYITVILSLIIGIFLFNRKKFENFENSLVTNLKTQIDLFNDVFNKITNSDVFTKKNITTENNITSKNINNKGNISTNNLKTNNLEGNNLTVKNVNITNNLKTNNKYSTSEIWRYSGRQQIGNGKLYYIDRHTVDCPANHFMAGIRWRRYGDKLETQVRCRKIN